MKILLVEDNEIKLNKISAFVKEMVTVLEMVEVRSYTAAVKKIRSDTFDLVILDMSLPTYERGGAESGGRTRTFGGKEVALRLQRKNRNTPFLVLTQFDGFQDGERYIDLENLGAILKKDCGKSYLGLIKYGAINNNWKNELRSIVESVGGLDV